MKKIYSFLALAGIVVLAGCVQTAEAPVTEQAPSAEESTNATATNTEETDAQNPPEAEEFVSYSNDEFDFELRHPKTWEVKEETAEDTKKKIAIKNPETAVAFTVFPQGGFVSEEPSGQKKEAALTLDDKPARQTEYDNGLIIVRPQEFPASWSGEGRIELSTDDPNNFYEMMTSFGFIE